MPASAARPFAELRSLGGRRRSGARAAHRRSAGRGSTARSRWPRTSTAGCSSPIRSTSGDARELGYYVAFVQEVTPYGLVGFRFDFYDGNSDFIESRRGELLPREPERAHVLAAGRPGAAGGRAARVPVRLHRRQPGARRARRADRPAQQPVDAAPAGGPDDAPRRTRRSALVLAAAACGGEPAPRGSTSRCASRRRVQEGELPG